MENPIRQNKWMIWGYPHEWTHPYNYHISSLSSWLPMKPTKGSGAKPLFCSWLLHNPEALSAMFPPFRRGPRQSGALSLSLSPSLSLHVLNFAIWSIGIAFDHFTSVFRGASELPMLHQGTFAAWRLSLPAAAPWNSDLRLGLHDDHTPGRLHQCQLHQPEFRPVGSFFCPKKNKTKIETHFQHGIDNTI